MKSRNILQLQTMSSGLKDLSSTFPCRAVGGFSSPQRHLGVTHDYCQCGTLRFVAFFQYGAGDVSKWRSPNSFKNGDGRWVKDEGLWVVSLAILQLVRPKVSAWVNKALELLTSLAMLDMVDWKALIWSVVQRLEKIDTTNRWEVQRRSFKTSKRPRNERDKRPFDWSPFYCQHRFSCSSGRWRWLWIISTLPDDLGRHPESMWKVDLRVFYVIFFHLSLYISLFQAFPLV